MSAAGPLNLGLKVRDRVVGHDRVGKRALDVRSVGVTAALGYVNAVAGLSDRRRLGDERRCAGEPAMQEKHRRTVAGHLMPGLMSGDIDVCHHVILARRLWPRSVG